MNSKAKKLYKAAIHIFFSITALTYILPLIMVISISLSSEKEVTAGIASGGGFSLLPKNFTLDAYRSAFQNSKQILNAYLVTIGEAFGGTLLTLLVEGMVAYPLSRTQFAYKNAITKFLFITMLFSGGTIPTYIIYTKWYKLGDSFLVYILPGLGAGAWNIFMLRTYFKGIGESLYESAWLDGANELVIFLKIAFPLATPIFAAIGFLTLVGKWNDWSTSLIYIRNQDLYTLQYLLQRVLNEVDFLKKMSKSAMAGSIDLSSFTKPAETLRYALCVIAAGPMLLIFPFFQKYFAKGLMIGSLKG